MAALFSYKIQLIRSNLKLNSISISAEFKIKSSVKLMKFAIIWMLAA